MDCYIHTTKDSPAGTKEEPTGTCSTSRLSTTLHRGRETYTKERMLYKSTSMKTDDRKTHLWRENRNNGHQRREGVRMDRRLTSGHEGDGNSAHREGLGWHRWMRSLKFSGKFT